MPVVIRLNIRGRKHLAFHKVVVADSRAPRDGRHIEILGHYDPLAKPPVPAVVINAERAMYWLSKGAQPSEQVASLLKKVGIVRPVKLSKPKKKESDEKKKLRLASNKKRAAIKKATPVKVQVKKIPSKKKAAAKAAKKKGAKK